MLSLDIRHPDAETFIDMKKDRTSVTGANVSVRMRDDFMKAALNDETYVQRFPINVPVEEALFTQEVKAAVLFDKLVHNAWESAEPGCLFWDRILEESPANCYPGFQELSTNPCGELPLCPYDSCRLLVVNLYTFVKNPFTSQAYFDWAEFTDTVYKAQRLMDDVVDIEIEQIDKILKKIDEDPEDDEVKERERKLWTKIRENAVNGRRTGLGVTALGDMFAALGIRYGSETSIEFADEVFNEFKNAAYASSIAMANERGAFPLWNPDLEKNNPFLNRLDKEILYTMNEIGRRNISLLTIAPTGTVSLMTRTTSGVENLFQVYYYRLRKINPNDGDTRVDFVDELGDKWTEFVVFHPKFETWLSANGYNVENVKKFSREELDEIVKYSPYYGATANDVDWVQKVKLQGVIQKHIDHSISVTVNLPKDITVEKVKEVYVEAWRSGCKGITVYRDGSRSGVLNTTSKKDATKQVIRTTAPKRPKKLPCDIHHTRVGGEVWKIVVGFLEKEPYEVFAFKCDKYEKLQVGSLVRHGRGKYDLHDSEDNILIEDIASQSTSEEQALTRIISTALRHGSDIKFIVDQLNKSNGFIGSFSKAVARTLSKYVGIEETGDKCTECGGNLVREEGCMKCYSCGASRCG